MERFKIRYDDHGRPCAITKGGHDIIHIKDSERTMENIQEFVKFLNVVTEGLGEIVTQF